ncbi:hypothetical protein ACA910_004138 [Epithemia clementina (nom. ined.)]
MLVRTHVALEKSLSVQGTRGDRITQPFQGATRIEAARMEALGNNDSKRILLVHLGKTGGETLKHILRVGCSVRTNILLKERCWRRFSEKYGTLVSGSNSTRDDNNSTIQEPLLSILVTGYFHYRRVTPPSAVENSTHFLFTVRHPLARIQSWFRYISPLNCIVEKDDEESGSSKRRRKRIGEGIPVNCRVRKAYKKDPTSTEAKFFQCFPTLEYMASALHHLSDIPNVDGQVDSKESTHDHICTQRLREIIQSNYLQYWGASESLMGHFVMNYYYYTQRTIGLNQNASILVLRTESLWQDLKELDIFLGGSGQFQNEGLRVTHNSERFIDKAALSVHASRVWCCVLQNELRLYRTIIELAANLDAMEKARTLQYTAQYCHWDSWDELLGKCQPFSTFIRP